MKMKINLSHISASLILCSGFFMSCNPDEEEVVAIPSPVDNSSKQAVIDNYANIVYASYEDAVFEAENLRTVVVSFLANPTDAGFDACKQAYIASREPYGQTDGFRFCDGPIDDENGKEGLMNGWPMDELFVDYVTADASSGIINNPQTHPVINSSTLEGLNAFDGETNIATGYHAIEFLLWGQDLSATSPGQRAFTDYVANGSGTNLNQERRGQYLLAVVDLLIQNLQYTTNAWIADEDNYRKTFETQNIDSSLQKMITGIGRFCKAELFGERMATALNTQDQEDEHSCFSDQTHRDFQLGITGIENVYKGNYTRIDGTVIDGKGLDELIAETNSASNNEAIGALTETKNAIFLIQAPFDQEIINAEGRIRVQNAIAKGNILADKIAAAASSIGIAITL